MNFFEFHSFFHFSLLTTICFPFVIGTPMLAQRQTSSCEHTPTSRNCWGDYSIDTDYSTVTPETGVTREYWLVAQNVTLAPDGYEKQVLVFNDTYPGPTIEANWGDEIIIHVKNEMPYNGTAIHWHGIRQLGSNQHDGVPGVTQCPIAPGETMTYKFRAQQYGTSWYHSHYAVQMGDGLYGALIIHGPATANYDEDLGPLIINDWFHGGAFEAFELSGKYGGAPIRPNSVAANGLINGTNTYDCTGLDDPACKGTGKRNLVQFVPGTRYRLRIIDAQLDSYMKFSVDGHSLTVIANDLVPIVPYTTDSIVLGSGQRYDVIIEANQEVGNYWMRAIYQTCGGQDNENKDNVLGIVRYEGADETDPTTNPSSTDLVCGDEPYNKLVPHLAMDVGNPASQKNLNLGFYYELDTVFHWTVNTIPLIIDWSKPTNMLIHDNVDIFPTKYNVYNIPNKEQWIYLVIQETVFILDAYHPFHLHGHDFHILAQGKGIYNPLTVKLNRKNPPRRDTASMPGNGFLVIAFKTDNPGSWLFHCHIAWHASQSLALQFVERESEISDLIEADYEGMKEICKAWDSYYATAPYHQEDSGI